MKFQKQRMLLAFSMAAVSGGCATTEPQQLVNARSLYVTANAGATATLSPTELYDAKKVLDQANAEYVNNGDTEKVRAYAYVATRKIQLRRGQSPHRSRPHQDRRRRQTRRGRSRRAGQRHQGALADSRQQLKDERAANTASTSELKATNAAQGKELEKSAAQLQTEREARTASETRLSAAMRDLAAVALVRDEPRGVVITLSGSVLFPPAARSCARAPRLRLDQVAQAFSAQVDDQRMVVEGHHRQRRPQ